MVFTHQDVFHSTYMFNILYNTFFFKALNFFIKMAKNKIPKKKEEEATFSKMLKKTNITWRSEILKPIILHAKKKIRRRLKLI